MATYSGRVRQGLPRVPGGEPWPKDGVAASSEPAHTGGTAASSPVSGAAPAAAPAVEAVPAVQAASVGKTVSVAGTTVEVEATPLVEPIAAPSRVVRQGLPRVPGGEPWPPQGVAAGTASQASSAGPEPAAPKTAPETPAPDSGEKIVDLVQEAPAPAPASEPAPTPAMGGVGTVTLGETPLRRGLPRTAGGEPWPAEGFAPAQIPSGSVPPVAEAPAVAAAVSEEGPVEAVPQPAGEAFPAADTSAETVGVDLTPEPDPEPDPAPAPVSEPAAEPAVESKPVTAPAKKPVPVSAVPKPEREPVMIAGTPLATWVKRVVLGGLGAIVAAGIIVLAARGVTTLPGVPEWMARYPGQYTPAVASEPGFPWWARWSHFFNFFLMALIIRSGWQVRTQQQPPAFWTPKRGGKKVSINLWLHTSLDVLWMVNGAVFVVLLFVTGHWARIVPTSFEVFPNAASAMLQYLTLDWPVDDAWVNYNALQQLMYFIVVFIAAPVAIITGLRMSEWWPEKADRLNKLYPAPVARAVHFPTMLFFVLFIIVHVFLVFATGALRNLNHMFAGTNVVNWTGFWLFAAAIFVTAAAWVAARPLVLAPIANLFGRVSNR